MTQWILTNRMMIVAEEVAVEEDPISWTFQG
jgi:hypothetical protein